MADPALTVLHVWARKERSSEATYWHASTASPKGSDALGRPNVSLLDRKLFRVKKSFSENKYIPGSQNLYHAPGGPLEEVRE